MIRLEVGEIYRDYSGSQIKIVGKVDTEKQWASEVFVGKLLYHSVTERENHGAVGLFDSSGIAHYQNHELLQENLRLKPVKLTISEISERLGYPVEIVE